MKVQFFVSPRKIGDRYSVGTSSSALPSLLRLPLQLERLKVRGGDVGPPPQPATPTSPPRPGRPTPQAHADRGVRSGPRNAPPPLRHSYREFDLPRSLSELPERSYTWRPGVEVPKSRPFWLIRPTLPLRRKRVQGSTPTSTTRPVVGIFWRSHLTPLPQV